MQAYELDSPEHLRAHLAEGRLLYQPLPDAQGALHWQALGRDEAPPFVAPREPPAFSAKAFFFAEREALFRYERGQFIPLLPEVRPQVLFGLQACDLTAVAYQDRFFAEDPHYQARRAATLLVGIDCQQSCLHGFCATMDSGPDVRPPTADLILCPLERNWLLLVTSVRGEQALHGLQLPAAAQGWEHRRAATALRIAAAQGEQAEIAAGRAVLNAGALAGETWEALGLRCLGCSGCTSVCPTCSCFAPLAQTEPNGVVVQERVWDSCLYQGFQKEASGHNPSATPGQRVQRFWYHKFGEDFRQRFGRDGCVGCGRCDAVCPGGIGVHQVMKRIARP
ncbi:4Fe-4S dicluster domain-containing protein [Stutzerimonas stutzeri]|uniref:4Fe-4S dicluster domain-containing protein n=1 Tax=Stutzerimonas sp. S1 TaxID=3030652 RepID=UPI0022244CCD|nr:4Fe-4S dicluster domain-containing protein [Stutzerimonas sp. S1]MCW3149375.1 4Fe-4S dicluster domain-containing protein [Stutzerimonas sp. S1]